MLTLDASAPLKINYLELDTLLNEESKIQISMRSNSFDIVSFGSVLPYIKGQSGKIESKIDIVGPLNNLNTTGYFFISEGKFTFRQNNLDYGFDLKTLFNNQKAVIENFKVYNIGGSEYSGTINGDGEVGLKYFPYSDFDIKLNGDLALLGKKSETRNASVYGDLLVKTSKDWKFRFKDDKYSFIGDVIIDKADLVYALQKDIKARQNGNIVYKYLADTSKININNQKFIKILNESRLNSLKLTENENSKFDINTNIYITNIASFNFLIAPELNQKLSVETTGRLEFETRWE